MSKKTPKFSKATKKRYQQLNQRLSRYLVAVDNLYDALESDAASLALSSGYEAASGLFKFSLSVGIKRAFEKLVNTYVANIAYVVDRGTKQEWERAEQDHDSFVQDALDAYKADPSDPRYLRYVDHVSDARDAFLAAQRSGEKGWSERVWNLRAQTQQDMELAISASFADGTSAATLATQMKQYLNEPDRLFRRVRNEYGELELSKNAAAYHPGPGIYRSSYKNALRLTRTEINMAYRHADIARYQKEDFVVGFEIKLSGRHDEEEKEDICDELAGKYPKDFDWGGWHPNCRCYQVPILKTEDEFFSDDDMPSVNQVDEPPQAFMEYMEDNAERIEAARQRGTLPFWVKDNFVFDNNGNMSAVFGKELGFESITAGEPGNSAGAYNPGEFVDTTKEAVIDNFSSRQNRMADEEAYVFLADGRVMHKNGNATMVSFSAQERGMLEGADLIHSHPSETLSPEDIAFAANNRLNSIEAVTKDVRYTAETTAETPTMTLQEVKEAWNRMGDEIFAEMQKMNSAEYDKALLHFQQENIRRLCEYLSINYKETPIRK